MSVSPSPAPFALPSLVIDIVLAAGHIGTHMWSSVPGSTAASSPVSAPDTDAEDEKMLFKGEAEDNDNDGSSPFLRGVSLSDGEVACVVAWAQGAVVLLAWLFCSLLSFLPASPPLLIPSPFPNADARLQIPVLMYHGIPVERAEMRPTILALLEGFRHV
ncbi:hypothetical protein MVEN_01413900 [Mycena venus]|uniref:Uncharacterized protein n=1 Tax=Mycena venus TaxID=2733690 RepID=A0A8H6XZ92_9AGAR|nr:hypothetical protein MVEN_01413900 [Mycena venus]